jgi:hypothetical protein
MKSAALLLAVAVFLTFTIVRAQGRTSVASNQDLRSAPASR